MKNKMAFTKTGYRTGQGQKMIYKSSSCLQLGSSIIDKSADQQERRLRRQSY